MSRFLKLVLVAGCILALQQKAQAQEVQDKKALLPLNASDAQDAKKLKERLDALERKLETVTKENELMKKENELVKKEIELLKKENDLLKREARAGGGAGKSETTTEKEKTNTSNATFNGVEYDVKCSRIGTNVTVSIVMRSLKGDKVVTMLNVTATDSEGNPYQSPRILRIGTDNRVQVQLREGVKRKVQFIMPVPASVRDLSLIEIQLPPAGSGFGGPKTDEETPQFRNIKIEK